MIMPGCRPTSTVTGPLPAFGSGEPRPCWRKAGDDWAEHGWARITQAAAAAQPAPHERVRAHRRAGHGGAAA